MLFLSTLNTLNDGYSLLLGWLDGGVVWVAIGRLHCTAAFGS